MINRRTFIQIQGLAAGALVLLPLSRAEAKKLAVGLDKAEALKKVGGSVTLAVKGQEILFIRDSETTIRAVDPTCTHQKCKVAFNPEKKIIECACHKSAFGLDGAVLAGPAPRPLTTFPATLDGERIIITVE